MTSVKIRPGSRNDSQEIYRLIQEFADFLQLSHQLKLTIDEFEKDAFSGTAPTFHVLVADNGDGKLIAYCLYFYTYSSFQGKSVYLEDLYVTQSFRGKGIGTRLIKELSKVAMETNCARLDFNASYWNKKALDFYNQFGCEDLTETEQLHLLRIGKPQLQAANVD